jgi:hypothetical protein
MAARDRDDDLVAIGAGAIGALVAIAVESILARD